MHDSNTSVFRISIATMVSRSRRIKHCVSWSLAKMILRWNKDRASIMNLDQLFILVERLRKEAIGEPKSIEEKKAFEYQDHSAKVVAVLKLIRAAHGVSALNLLCYSGLFIDFGVIIRCVYDCETEVYFLLEDFPKTSINVEQFIKSFFESTIDGYLSNETPPVPTKKIRSAMVRVLKGGQNEETRSKNRRYIQNIFRIRACKLRTHNGGL